MPRYILLFYLFCLFGIQGISYSQEITSNKLDPLIISKIEIFEDKFYKALETNRPNAEIYAKAYLQKGKKDKSDFKKSMGFYYMSKLFIDNHERRIIYLDSAIEAAKKTKYTKRAAYLYTHKGAISEKRGDYNKALDYYLEGLHYSEHTENLFYVSVLQSNIATIKRKLGKYEEAKLLFKKCLSFDEKRMGKKRNDSIPYLLTLSDLVTTYLQNQEIDSAFYYYDQGNKISTGTDIEGLFRLNEGIFHFHNKGYKSTIKTVKIGLNKFLKSKYKIEYGNHNLINSYLYLGKAYNALSMKDSAVIYFKKIDSVVQESNDLVSEARPAYLEIIKHYKSLGDKNNQLYYINRLLHNDSIFNNRHKSISAKLLKEYDTPLLLSQKEQLISELKTKNDQSYYGLIISSIIILIISIILFISYQKNKRYKKRFDELINITEKEVKTENHEDKTIQQNSIGIAEDVVEIILKELDKFEKNNGFLEVNITSTILSKKINTNSKYLTKVIKYYRKKSFSPYINDLRIDYITSQLKIDHKLQNYTIKALATEAGFNSAEVFSKSFLKKTGIYPSYFVKRLKTHKNLSL